MHISCPACFCIFKFHSSLQSDTLAHKPCHKKWQAVSLNWRGKKKEKKSLSAHSSLIHAGKVSAKTLRDEHSPRGIPSKLPEWTVSSAIGSRETQIPHPSRIAASKPLDLKHVFWEPQLHLNVKRWVRDTGKQLVLLSFCSLLPIYVCHGKSLARGVNSKSSPIHLGIQHGWFYNQMFPCRRAWEYSVRVGTQRAREERQGMTKRCRRHIQL